jgi:Na+/proline symporter
VAKGVEIATVVDPDHIAVWPIIGQAIIPAKATGIILCLSFATIYSALSGLWGVIATDFFQFCLAMTGTIALMVVCFVVADGPKAMMSKAYEAVNSGMVINQAPVDRSQVSRLELRKALEDKVIGDAEVGGPLDRLTAAGLLGDTDDRAVMHWTADGLTEAQVREKLADADIPNPDAVVGLWKKAYTMSKASFVEFDAIDRLEDAGLVSDDTNNGADSIEYYRIMKVDMTPADLHRWLDENDVEHRSDIAAAWRAQRVVPPRKIANFLPPFDLKGGGLVAIWSLIVFLGLQWWVGGEGGGFLAQRLFSCKNEKHSVMAMLWFNFLNFVVRPWPWIVVGIASLFLIPDITAYGARFDQEHAYVVMLMKYLPIGLKGLMVASLMAAYMSTISTHVNFGASYVINDLYKRFINPNCGEKKIVRISQWVSVMLAILAGLYALLSESVSTGWFVMFELMSGVGFVVLLRWYWWRISAWSELSAMFSSLGMYMLLNFTPVFQWIFSLIGAPQYLLEEYAVRFTLNIFCTTLVWVTVTFLTPPEKEATLIAFYKRIRPAGWWKRVATQAGNPDHLNVGVLEWSCWGLGVAALFSMIVSVGKMCFGMYGASIVAGVIGVASAWLMFVLIGRMDWSGMETTPETEE